LSVEALTYVWFHSKSRLATRLVALALADYADDKWSSYPGIKKLAQKARISPRQAQRCIQELISLGELKVGYGQSQYGTNVYEIQHLARRNVTPDNLPPLTNQAEIVSDLSPKPSTKPSEENSEESSIKRRATRITEDFITRMITEHGERMGGEQAVRDAIQDSVDHVAYTKRSDKQRYVMNWLTKPPKGNTYGKANGTGPYPKLDRVAGFPRSTD
jgi:hypothetical protein